MAEEKAKKQANPAVIQAVKAIAVLVIICLVCGALLALCNDLLYISDQDRLERAMQKVYKNFELQEELTVNPDPSINSSSSFGKVNRVLLSKDGAYIIEALGIGGYQNGTVTLYVIIGADAKIKGWAVKDNDKQSYIDRIPSYAGTTWYVGVDATEDKTLDTVMTGATVSFTSNAIKNAINMATSYYRKAILGSNPEGEAREAVLALLSGSDYSGYDSLELLSSVKRVIGTALDGENDTLKYLFIGEGAKGKIYVYVYGEDEDRKIVVVNSEAEVVLTSDNVDEAADFYAKIVTRPIREITVGSVTMYTFVSNGQAGETTTVYKVVALSPTGYMPGNYTLTITVKTEEGKNNGIVVSVEIAENGDGYAPDEHAPSTDDAHALLEGLKGATLENFDEKYNDGIVSGATESGNIIAAAVKAALTDYDARLAQND